MNWAKDIGDEVLLWVKTVLNQREHPEQAYRVCLGLLNLSRSYPAERLNNACAIAKGVEGVISVSKLPSLKAGLIITGNEVFHGRIKDAFEPVLREKLTAIGSEVIEVRFAPDNIQIIADEIKSCLAAGAEIIITSGGMSVDPDDVTRQGIKKAGKDSP